MINNDQQQIGSFRFILQAAKQRNNNSEWAVIQTCRPINERESSVSIEDFTSFDVARYFNASISIKHNSRSFQDQTQVSRSCWELKYKQINFNDNYDQAPTILDHINSKSRHLSHSGQIPAKIHSNSSQIKVKFKINSRQNWNWYSIGFVHNSCPHQSNT